MKDTVRLGRIGGVPIGLNWSLLAIIAIFAYGLAENRFPFDAPGYGAATYDAVGALTAVALLVAVLLHELGHALLARKAGLEVEGITLSWMGGVTRIVGDTRSPGREFGVAAIGPAVSLAIGAVLWGVRVAVSGGHPHGLGAAALGWLAVINVALALFNLLPAAPLDGGRVLHSVIWAVSRDRWKASRATSWAGMALAGLVIALGTWQVVSRRGQLDGLLIVMLGWWIMGAARDEDRQAVVHRALDGLEIHDVMRPVAAAPGWITTAEFVHRYAAAAPSTVWMLERWGGGYSGVISGDALCAVPAPLAGARPSEVAVPVEAAGPTQPFENLLEALERTGGRQVLLAVEDGRTVGAVLPTDIEALVQHRGRRTGRPALGPATS